MPIYLGDTLQRGQSGAGAFPVAIESDLKVSSILVADLTARANIPSWKLMSKMLVYVISEDKNYRLEPDLVTWTEVVSSDPNALVYDDVFNSEGFIKSGLIQNLFINDSYVVASEAAMLLLTTITGNAVIRTDTGQVFIKLNNNDPSVLGDFADITGNTGAVTSVNGQTGSVSITIANLLAVAQNTTDFNTAVAVAPSVSTLIGAVSDLQTLYTTLSSNVSSIQITVSSLSTDVTTLQSDVSELQANLVIPDPTGHSTQYLTTPDGITLAWANAGGLLPSQAGQIGKFLTTDGTNAYWSTVDMSITIGSTPITGGSSGNILYHNSGVIGEKLVTGSGNVVLSIGSSITSATIVSLSATTTEGETLLLGGTAIASSAVLEIRSTTKGLLGPTMTSAQKNAISSPATGLIVYDTDSKTINSYNGLRWAEDGYILWVDESTASGGGTNSIPYTSLMPDDSQATFEVIANGIGTGGGEGYSCKKIYSFRKDGSAAPVPVGSVSTVIEVEDSAFTPNCTLSVSGSNFNIIYTPGIGNSVTYKFKVKVKIDIKSL